MGACTAFFAGSLTFCRAEDATTDAAVADFYRGKTITIVIGSAAGGGYDLVARVLGRYMGRYVPGRPFYPGRARVRHRRPEQRQCERLMRQREADRNDEQQRRHAKRRLCQRESCERQRPMRERRPAAACGFTIGL